MLPADEKEQAGWIEKEAAETDWEYGERPETRSLEDRLDNGLVLIDKPDGPKSQKVSLTVKKELGRAKAGHAGTLDPNVTGVLPVGLNKGTKVLHALSHAGKEYVGEMELGDEFDIDELSEAGSKFTGVVKQTPPEISAVKREERERRVFDLEFLEVDGSTIRFRIQCQHGFYVRTFCRDFGKELGTEGEMTDLRRTRVASFTDDDLVPLDDLVESFQSWLNEGGSDLGSYILPVEAGVRHLRKILVKDSAVAAVCHGANLGTQGIVRLQEGIEEGESVALLTLKGELIATAKAKMSSEEMVDKRATAVNLQRVFMANDVYPKKWT